MIVLMMIDGLRPEAITPAVAPHLTQLMARGASTRQARSVMPCITLPCHMSIFHSVPPARHGVTTNTWSPMARPVPGLVDLAQAAGQRCVFFINWEPLRNLNQPGSLYFSHFHDNVQQLDGDDLISAEAIRWLPAHRPDFAFVYHGTTDEQGHNHGWMSAEYLAQVKRVDGLVGSLLAALRPDEDHILIQADHGGHDRSHGTEAPEDMTIPWMLAGPRIRPGHAIAGPVSLLDTAPTLARLLGLTPDDHWEGRCVDEAFAA
jgi:predicted AlkP superfamily pyrophosphatase or phosphodiesterase